MGDLGAWLSLLVIAFLLWKQGNKILAPVVQPCVRALAWLYSSARESYTARVQSSPGGEPAATELQESNQVVAALESESHQSNQVPAMTVSELEIAWIAYELGRGTTPSAAGKTLPGYSGRNYEEYMAKVGMVEALLAEKSAVEAERAERKSAKKRTENAGTTMLQEQSI